MRLRSPTPAILAMRLRIADTGHIDDVSSLIIRSLFYSFFVIYMALGILILFLDMHFLSFGILSRYLS
jgi:hypothetical protein